MTSWFGSDDGDELLGGDDTTLATSARDELLALGARNPERIADMVMPGISPR